ncbi:hypothetical protein EHI44_30925 [Rhizobium leguminosarum]|uniref:SPW repeat domain-containing protein n=1 Tax=Rhizobium leguminosarum TaxID=384 RepID=UPI000FF73ED8|nr:hypothetical protein [Rhizobium leguminosarum]RWY79920.1 hypothetical protein EHI44_30925 [Rhizobium leguminosarum]
MRFVPTIVHGIADYVVGFIVIGLPFFLEFSGTPRMVLIALGIIVVLYSLLTDYEIGAVRFLRIRFHLLLDAIFGVAMLLSPWLVHFPMDTRWPVYAIGVVSPILATTTQIRDEGTAATN